MSKKSNKFSPEERERAVCMVREHRSEYPSLSPRVTIVVASIEPRTLGAAMKEISGEIRTNIQEPGGCSVAASRERSGRGGGQGSWD